MGAGGQIGFADPGLGVGCGFVRNHLENQALPLMGACLVDVLYSCMRRSRGQRCTQLNTQQSIRTSRRSIMAPSGRVVTFAEYEAGANQVAHLLRETGLRRRDHMAIFMENDPAMLLTEAGAERTGLYFTPVNSYLSAEEVAYVVNDSQSRVVVTSAAKAEVARAAAGAVPQRRALDHRRRSGRPRRSIRVVGRGGGHAEHRRTSPTSSWARR